MTEEYSWRSLFMNGISQLIDQNCCLDVTRTTPLARRKFVYCICHFPQQVCILHDPYQVRSMCSWFDEIFESLSTSTMVKQSRCVGHVRYLQWLAAVPSSPWDQDSVVGSHRTRALWPMKAFERSNYHNERDRGLKKLRLNHARLDVAHGLPFSQDEAARYFVASIALKRAISASFYSRKIGSKIIITKILIINPMKLNTN